MVGAAASPELAWTAARSCRDLTVTHRGRGWPLSHCQSPWSHQEGREVEGVGSGLTTLGPRLGSTPSRKRRVAPGAARSGSGCGSQAASRGPPPAPEVEPPSGDDPAGRLPHPQCSLWACRAAPSWRGVRSGASEHTTFRGPRGCPASQLAMGRSGRTIAVTGRPWAGLPGTPPQ